ncbi:MAG: IS3 family transposase [Mycobacterium sp.]|nr:IS3 family transposase [Mycobacterium sp.]
MTEKYVFIAAQRAACEAVDAPTVAQMTSWLGVSKSGFYEWDGRAPSDAERRREELKIKIKTLFESFDATYGYRRIHAELARTGEHVGQELVRKLMRELDLVAVQPKPYKRTTVPGEADPAVADLVCRDFTAERPGIKLVGDITYIPTWQGWLFLATVIDCFNKEVIGWSMAQHMRTELVTDALDMAARNHVLEPGCITHSDRGAQYTSAEYIAKLGELGLQHSLGRTGICLLTG